MQRLKNQVMRRLYDMQEWRDDFLFDLRLVREGEDPVVFWATRITALANVLSLIVILVAHFMK